MIKKELETSLVIPVTPEFIERRIFLVRGQKVMLDNDLAELYQVSTKYLNKTVNRNRNRFPEDFMFQLSKKEYESLRFQFGTSKKGRGGRRYMPYVFTELGVSMLSSVLNSERAIQMNIYIMRAFMRLREMIATHAGLAQKIAALEKGQKTHSEHLLAISLVLKRLMNEPAKTGQQIGFDTKKSNEKNVD